MTSSRPTDDCLALLELLLWNHLLRSAVSATGAGQPLAETSTPTGNYLDWMAMRGLVRREQLLGEAFRSGDAQVVGTPDLHPGRSPLALTDAGARFAVQALRREGKWEQIATLLALDIPPEEHVSVEPASGQQGVPDPRRHGQRRKSPQPSWDVVSRELRMDDGLVKKVRISAVNQQRILAAFEEERWPEYVYDPLPPVGDVDPKQRLLDAVRRLNGHQLFPRIQFHIAFRGERVGWRPDVGGRHPALGHRPA